MNKKNLLIIWVITWFIILIFVFYKEKEIIISNSKNYDILVKNNSWDTNFLENTPYKKSEEIEYNIIFSWENSNVSINLEEYNKNLKLKKIFLNDIEKSKNDSFDVKEWDSLKIIWETINNGIVKKSQLDNIIKVTPVKKEEDLKDPNKIPEKISTWTINITLDKTSLNWNINNLVEILWEWKDKIKYVTIWQISLTPISENNKVLLTIEKDSFSSWEYFIIVQLKDNTLLTLNEKITITHSKDMVNIANITPNNIKNWSDRYIVLQWNWFSKVISMQLSNNVVLKNTSFNIISDNVISVKIPGEILPWNYYFNIMTTSWITELKNNIFTIN